MAHYFDVPFAQRVPMCARNISATSPVSATSLLLRRARPVPGVEELTYYATRCLNYLLPILEFLRLIIQHHGVDHQKSSLVVIHNTRRRTPLTSARDFALPEMTNTGLRICIACFGRISRGVPRAVFSFTITRHLVRMKK